MNIFNSVSIFRKSFLFRNIQNSFQKNMYLYSKISITHLSFIYMFIFFIFYIDLNVKVYVFG